MQLWKNVTISYHDFLASQRCPRTADAMEYIQILSDCSGLAGTKVGQTFTPDGLDLVTGRGKTLLRSPKNFYVQSIIAGIN